MVRTSPFRMRTPVIRQLGWFYPLLILVAGFTQLSACDSNLEEFDELDPGTGDLVWVSKEFSGGVQCTGEVTYVPPDTRVLMSDSQIAVFALAVEHQAVCLACSCPAYAARHFAQIRSSNVDRARMIGFEVSEEPAEDFRVPVAQ